jgi:hypothetical protein
MQNNCTVKYKNSELHNILQEPIQEAIRKGIHEREELKNYVNDFLRDKKIYSPSPSVLDRIVGTITNETICNPEAEEYHFIEEAIGKEITSI